MFKRLFIAIVLLGLVVGGIVWFKYFREQMIAQVLGGMVPAPVPVNAETVVPVTWKPGIDAVGTAISAQGVDLAIESSGLIREVRFTSNEDVTEGQQLLQIDDESEKASLAAATASLSLALAEASRARTLTDRGVGAATTLETAEAQVESARAEMARVQTSLDHKKLTAPFAGVIGIPQVEIGQYVSPGQIYATLQDLSRMRVDFSVPEQQIAALALGGSVSVASEVGGYRATGRITGIEPRVDPNTRMVSVRAEVENPSGLLLPGQFLRVSVALPEEQGVIAVPQTAVASSLYGDTIYVIRKGDEADDPEVRKVEQLFVKVGRRSGDRIEVVEGLKAGDEIVTSGQNRLTQGARVKIDNSVSLTPAQGADPAPRPEATPEAQPGTEPAAEPATQPAPAE
ncbi:efflux RND transporter periplasmic adaptor subunit [Pseudogemmobacter faecipullorum]|uniref:Efflux RND transporter periplasmic adaptor subunit n=1 Tax=Pseudogemmobacter faecipullorum TaxID=2755041 RepID=A0ABS8CPR9_9RHOB|nr:efflux RND transporter periplasmic adaptor subunit [Pseudogemmobacter faecipullorum]MCB5411397.1 efflux RND transporter periplasmic adaptor subunit [Pseudogemmobacter faecipullorum]